MLPLPVALIFPFAFLHDLHSYVVCQVCCPQCILFVAQVNSVTKTIIARFSLARLVRLTTLVKIVAFFMGVNALTVPSFVPDLILSDLPFEFREVELQVFVNFSHFHKLLLECLSSADGFLQLSFERNLLDPHLSKLLFSLNVLVTNLLKLLLQVIQPC